MLGEDPSGRLLDDLILALGRPKQGRLITHPLRSYNTRDNAFSRDPDDLWFGGRADLGPNGERFVDLKEELSPGEPRRATGSPGGLDLGRDLVLSHPWSRHRLLECYRTIGEGRPRGPWEQQENHKVDLYLPFGIGVVGNGNHSIATGIVRREGTLIASKVLDFRRVYEFVGCDGERFYRTSDGATLSEVRDLAWASVFELGRVRLEYVGGR